jgi:hypothetical protein
LKNGGGYPHQFFNIDMLDYLEEKELSWNNYLANIKDGYDLNENENLESEEALEKNTENKKIIKIKFNNTQQIPPEFTEKDRLKKEMLLSEGFGKWRKKEFKKLIDACELYGLNDYTNISKFIKTKSIKDVEIYMKIFLERINSLPNGKRLLARISKSENEKQKVSEYSEILDYKLNELSKKEQDMIKIIKLNYKAKNITSVHE